MGLFSNPIKKLTKRPNLKNPKDPLGLMGGSKGGNRPPPKGTPGQGSRLQNREERNDQSQAMSKLGMGRRGGQNFRKTPIDRPRVTGGPLPPNGNTGVVGPRTGGGLPAQRGPGPRGGLGVSRPVGTVPAPRRTIITPPPRPTVQPGMGRKKSPI